MCKHVLGCVGLCGVLALAMAGIAVGNGRLAGGEPAMMASPQTVVLEKVDTLTVHTNIPRAAVVPGTVELNGVSPLSVWADNRGHLAARFAVADFELEPGEAELTLTGDLVTGEEFEASDTVTVK